MFHHMKFRPFKLRHAKSHHSEFRHFRVRRHLKLSSVYIIFLVILALWSGGNHLHASVLARGVDEIPQEAIRLRILANSDSVYDQWIKREVRDAVVSRMDAWAAEPQTIEEARELVRSHLDDFQSTVAEVLGKHGDESPFSVELGIVPFPTKLYGNTVYPAGDYEALLIVIGKGEGKNWWCVLFPPLCFVDLASGDAVVAAQGSSGANAGASAAGADGQEAEIHFFLWDMLVELFRWIAGWFS